MPPKKKANDNLDELRELTKQQAAKQRQNDILTEKLHERLNTARTLLEQAQCPSEFCQGAGVCDWCRAVGDWLRETK